MPGRNSTARHIWKGNMPLKVNLLARILLIAILLGVSPPVHLATPAAAAPLPAPHLDATGVRHYPGWFQTMSGGFADPQTGIWSMAAFGGNLYAGTTNDSGAAIWRSPDGRRWTKAVIPGWTAANAGVLDLKEYAGQLYAGVYNENGAQVWRTDGSTWEQTVAAGFGDAANITVSAFAVFGGRLYAATGSPTNGVRLWQTDTGDAASWSPAPVGAMGGSGTLLEVVMDTFGSFLYVGLSRNDRAELWRSGNGVDWDAVIYPPETGNSTHVSGLAEFDGNFYAGFRNLVNGAQIWRSPNGADWTPIVVNGLDDASNGGAHGLIVFQEWLHVVFMNPTGVEVWRMSTGRQWQRLAGDGWGDHAASYADYYDKGAAVFNGHLYVGTVNGSNGGEVWELAAAIVRAPVIVSGFPARP